MALNGGGFRILSGTGEVNEVLAHYPLDAVEAVRHYTLSECYFVEIALSAKSAQQLQYGVVTVETEMSQEVTTLFDQYTYLGGAEKEPAYARNGHA